MAARFGLKRQALVACPSTYYSARCSVPVSAHRLLSSGARNNPQPSSTRSQFFNHVPVPLGNIIDLEAHGENGLQAWSKRSGAWAPLSGRWLRDHCPCTQCRNPQTGQRQINVLRDSKLGKIETCTQDKDGNYVVTFADGHSSVFIASELQERRGTHRHWHRTGTLKPETWTSKVAGEPPAISYNDLENNTKLGALMLKIRKHGFCFVTDSPPTPEATQTLLEAIGPIRNTHYGGFYDFTSDLSSKDTAYTSEALEPHTDNTYFTEPAGLQALHMLSHTEGTGGESSLVDGFEAARQLHGSNPAAYDELTKWGVYAHASGNDDVKIQPTSPAPVLTYDSAVKQLIQVRWNTADRSELSGSWFDVDKWYDAAAQFDAIVNNKDNQYWFNLEPGKILIFDNWRVLHGRSAFTGKRRMCGGYINRDDYISRYRVTNQSPEELNVYT